MFQKIKDLLQGAGKNRQGREVSSKVFLAQADLSERLMWSLGLAKKLGLRVYIRIDVGNQSHGISVQGKDDPTLEYLYDLANESWKGSLTDAKEAILAEQEKNGVGDCSEIDGRKGRGGGFK